MIQVLLFKLKEDQFKEKIKFKELTFCYRINMETFRRLNTYGFILHGLDGAGWENGTEVDWKNRKKNINNVIFYG